MQFRTSLLLFGIVAVTSARLHFDSRSDVGIQERQQSCQSEVDALARTIESCGRAIASPNPDGPIRGFVGCICFDETNEIVAGALNCAASANTDTVLDPQTAYNSRMGWKLRN
ncbi:hypothetical protein MPER_08325 [Moniliophthora perniciosa FA553]|nr:hypothetical protein MPER_08325 [Moniliophthora perniciosa FA553]